MSGAPDHYFVLGVSRSADQDAIKQAYKNLVRRFHPDQNPGDQGADARFRAIQQAYEVLGDVNARSKYDGRFRFPSLPRGQRGHDLKYQLSVDVLDTFAERDQTIQFESSRRCLRCGGVGAEPGSSPLICKNCDGRGKLGANACPHCNGSGKRITEACPDCRSSGQEPVNRRLTISVPAGVSSGTRLRLKGEGEAGSHGGEAGDLFVDILVEDHALYRMDGADLRIIVPVRLTDALLGHEIMIPSFVGPVRLKLPENAKSGQTFRLKGKGPQTKNRRGDIVAELRVETPSTADPEIRDLLEQLHAKGFGHSEESRRAYEELLSRMGEAEKRRI